MTYGAYVTVRFWCPNLFDYEDLERTGKSAVNLASDLFHEEGVGITEDPGEVLNISLVEDE